MAIFLFSILKGLILLFFWMLRPKVPTYRHILSPAVPCKSTRIHINIHDPPPTHAHTALQAPHALVLIWNMVGGAGPVQGSVNSSGATPPFERPKFPFLRSAAWAGSAVLQAFRRHRRPQRPRWQHFTGNMAWQGWPDGPPRSAHCHTEHWHKRAACSSHALVRLCLQSGCVCGARIDTRS